MPFAPGLNVLTGETGAGKSILVDALLLVRGRARPARPHPLRGRDGHGRGGIRPSPGSGAGRTVLEEAGLAAATTASIVIRRELARSGGTAPSSTTRRPRSGLLERLGDALVEVHGQHEHQRLLEPARQLELLDRFADAEERCRPRWRPCAPRTGRPGGEAEHTRSAARERAQREDLYASSSPRSTPRGSRIGEEDALRAERRRLQHAERFATGLAEATALLDDDAAVGLGTAGPRRRAPAGPRPARPRRSPRPARPVEAALLQVRGSARRRSGALRDADRADPGRLEAIDERLDALARLKPQVRRRRGGDAPLPRRGGRRAGSDRAPRRGGGRAGARAGRARRRAGGDGRRALSERRRAAAGRLAGQVERADARARDGAAAGACEVARGARPPEAGGSARGADRVEFLLSTNPGEEVRPLARVASGGELSRTMLALTIGAGPGRPRAHRWSSTRSTPASAAGWPTWSATSSRRPPQGRQVLCVTHLAPIAALAHHHLLVSKRVRGGRTTRTTVTVAGRRRAGRGDRADARRGQRDGRRPRARPRPARDAGRGPARTRGWRGRGLYNGAVDMI